MTLLVFGFTGQVATELRAMAPVTALGRDAADLSDPEACAAAIRAHDPRRRHQRRRLYRRRPRRDRGKTSPPPSTAPPPVPWRGPVPISASPSSICPPITFSPAMESAPGNRAIPLPPLGAYGRLQAQGRRGRARRGRGPCDPAHVMGRLGPWPTTSSRRCCASAPIADKAHHRGRPDRRADACPRHRRGLPVDRGSADRRSHQSGTYHFSGAPDTSWADFRARDLRAGGPSLYGRGHPDQRLSHARAAPAQFAQWTAAPTDVTFGISRPDWRDGLRDILQDLASEGPTT